jgi:hypothetical protein
VQIDNTKWSGEGAFTGTLVEAMRGIPGLEMIRVEDAPATRSEADYNFITNEIFVRFEVTYRRERGRRLGFLPVTRVVADKTMTLADLADALGGRPDVGPADYTDEGMLQYLRTERVIPPYQTRGFKLVELVRIYDAGDQPALPSDR